MQCPACGTLNVEGAQFCHACGGPLGEIVPGAVPESAAPAGNGKAIAALVLGILGLGAWCLPILGAPVTIVGLVLGCKALNSPARGMAMAGVVLCIIGLVLTIANAAVGAYMGATGQHPLVNWPSE